MPRGNSSEAGSTDYAFRRRESIEYSPERKPKVKEEIKLKTTSRNFVDEVEELDSKGNSVPTSPRPERGGSRFFKNQKGKRNSVKLKDKFKNVWKRSDSKQKSSSDEEPVEKREPTPLKIKGAKGKSLKENQSNSSSEEESSQHKPSLAGPSRSDNRRSSKATDSDHDISEDTRPDSVFSRRSSGDAVGKPGETVITIVKDEEVLEPEIMQKKKTTSKLLFAEEISRLSKHGIPDPTIWKLMSFEQPEIRSDADVKAWDSLLFSPLCKSLSLEQKLPEDVSVRFMEEEGIYVGKPIRLSKKNLHRLEHRLYMQKSLEWFGQDGNLIAFPDPYRQERIQLCQGEDFGQNLHPLVFQKAQADPYQEFHIDPKMNCEIVVDIGFVTFKHHHLFSPEHVVASQLEACFEKYLQRKETMITERAENRLKALREALSHCKQVRGATLSDRGGQGDSSEAQVYQLDERIRRYRNDMKTTRKERNESWRADKDCVTELLTTWRELKALRDQQEFINTPLKLNIIKSGVMYKKAKEVWKNEIEQEIEDLRQEYEDEFREKMDQYKSDLKYWNDQRRKRKHRRKKHKRTADETGDRVRDDGSDNDSEKSDGSLPSLTSKPVPPTRFDAEVVRSDVVLLFSKIRQQPGEPKLDFELGRTAPVTPRNQLNHTLVKELKRRRVVEKTKLEFKLLFNQKEVYQSDPKDLKDDFSVFFGFSIPINVREWPESLKLSLVETYKTNKVQVAEAALPLPTRKISIQRSQIQKTAFESTETIKTLHTGVGSGVPLVGSEDSAPVFTSGLISSRVGWTPDEEGNINCPRGFDKVHEMEDAKMLDTSAKELLLTGDIHKWSEATKLDPNDPRNSKLIHSIARRLSRAKSSKKPNSGSPASGRADVLSSLAEDTYKEETDFCTPEEIENSVRCKVLKLRDEEVPEFRHYRMVPNFDRDIPSSVFENYSRRLREETSKKDGDQESKLRKRFADDDTDYELNRMEKIKEIRTKVLKLFESSLRQITFDDIIVEEQIPDIGTLGLNIMTIFQPRRPLRPTRRERKRVQGSSLAETQLTLIVNIVRAFNLPLRKDVEVGSLTTEALTGVQIMKPKRAGASASGPSTVHPFVEVWFQRNVCRTTTALGANPTWNQELELNLHVPEDDYSQENLSKMDDLVYLLVYDEVAVDLLEDDRRRETDIYQRLEKRWLGSITIPFSTLFTNGWIEGTFKLNSPTILLGYEAQGMSTHFISPLGPKTGGISRDTRSSAVNNNQKSTFITLFMTLQPAIQRSSITKEEIGTGETADMMAHVTAWKQGIVKRFPERNIKPFVMNMEGETILCIRYLKAIPPPEGLNTPESELLKVMEDLAHFVSLFPAIRDSTLGITDYSLWFTSDTFVATPGGGTEDHAVLLACFFMHLKIQCWILQGNAIPDGPTAYVLTTFTGQDRPVPRNMKNAYLIWNPCTGEHFLANDNFAPLQSVWAVIGSANIWANTMENDRPHQLDWDLSKQSNWKPLFTKPVEESKVQTVQIREISFKPADQIQANSLSQRIERHLKDVFMRWRKMSKTKWNRYCTAILRRLLPRLEEIRSGRNRTQPRSNDGSIIAESVNSVLSAETPSNINEEQLIELKDIIATYEMTGFPLHQPYVNFDSVTEAVFATGVHTIDTPDVEFAVAAYSRSYPAGVYSMWIYIAALHKRK